MVRPLRKLEISIEQDVVRVRQVARQIAALLNFDAQDQTRIATAVSEIGRNAFRYAGKAKAEFFITDEKGPESLCIRISDEGKGIAAIEEVLGGNYRSKTGMGLGIIGSKKLMDTFQIETGASGTTVTLGKYISKHQIRIDSAKLSEISEALVRQTTSTPYDEIRDQNLELLRTLEELRLRQQELTALNAKLEETNRGISALYSEVQEKSRILKDVTEAKTRFLSNVSHELRTPIVSVIGLCNLLLERTDGELTGEQETQIKYILKAAESMREMGDDFLDLAKVESGKYTVSLTDVKVSDLFATLRGMLRPLAARNPNVRLTFEEDGDLVLLRTDEGKLAQILRNFISNALKYTDQGEIKVTASCPGTNVRFSVTDTGIGISPENHGVIFEEFVQVQGIHQTRVKGTGLGLPVSKKLAELLGGRVELESDLGKGSRFSLLLPPTVPRAETSA